MRILILGGAGMLGHQLWRYFRPNNEVWVTLRHSPNNYRQYDLFDPERSLVCGDITTTDALAAVFRKARPDVVINGIGIIKQLKEAKNPLLSLMVNSLFPHRLAEMCAIAGSRLIHISTDCVFSGKKGNYTEEDVPDAEDLYGRTKYFGELHELHCVTLRTSIIGRELQTTSGLIEWFLSQQGQTIKGFRRAIYSGFTTPALACVIGNVLLNHCELSGVWHVSSDPINKFDLLQLAKIAFHWNGKIIPDDSFVCDRSLNSTRFREKTGFAPPSWKEMIEELARLKR